ncbi:unnamed protein product, partial [Meganyctiphanes norvegica]
MEISRRVKFGYGVGHIFNDLCACLWFTYLLVYLQYVLQLEKATAGLLLLLGQVADAVATPFVGIQSDKGCRRGCWWTYGKRKTWHLIGTILVLGSFPMVFIICYTCTQDLNHYAVLLAVMIVIFQFGWASTQVSHLSLIPDLTTDENERDELNIIRYFFDVSSDVLVYLVTWMVFTQEGEGFNSQIDPTDARKFTIVTVVVVVVGSMTSTLFHVLTPEKKTWETPPGTPTNDDDQPSYPLHRQHSSAAVHMSWKDWLTEPQFYQIAVLYTCSRLVGNLANIFMPIYLQESIQAEETLIALVPLVMSLSGVVASVLLKYLRKGVGKKLSMGIAIFLGMAAAMWSSMSDQEEWSVYCIAILWGLSGSLMIVLSLAFTSDLIGLCTSSSAFVYGCMSFWDKLINGIIVFIIQKITIYECRDIDGREEDMDCSFYYRMVMSIGMMFPLIVALIGLSIVASSKLGQTRQLRKAPKAEDSSMGSQSTSDSSEILLLTGGQNYGYSSITK